MALITAIGLARLDAGLAWIDENPEQHNQNMWMSRTPCGTTMCLAGVLVMLAGGQPVWDIDNITSTAIMPDGKRVIISDHATELLEMSRWDARQLFSPLNTREVLQYQRDELATTIAETP